MTQPEFLEWLRRYLTLFPDTKTWLDGVEDSAAIQAEWCRVLERTSLLDAHEVTSRMISGQDAAVRSFDRELTAAQVRRLAGENLLRREKAALMERQRTAARVPRWRGTDPSPAGLFAAMDGRDGTAQECPFPTGVKPDRTIVSMGRAFRAVMALIEGGLDRAQACDQILRPHERKLF